MPLPHRMMDGVQNLGMLDLKPSKARKRSAQKKLKLTVYRGHKCSLVLFGMKKYLLSAFLFPGTTPAPSSYVKPGEHSEVTQAHHLSSAGGFGQLLSWFQQEEMWAPNHLGILLWVTEHI